MRTVRYEDVPDLCFELLGEVEATGLTIEIVKDGHPYIRMMPVDNKPQETAVTDTSRKSL